MNRREIAALGHPEGVVLDKAVAVAKAIKTKAKKNNVITNDDRIKTLLEHIKMRPTAYTNTPNDESVQALAWAWLGTKQEVEA